MPKHPLAVSSWGAEELAAAERVLRSGHTTMGAEVRAFEDEIAAYVGTRYAVMVNSGSSANLLMVAAYTLQHGAGTVIAPALSWATSYSPFVQYGWRFHFVDIDASLCLDTDAIPRIPGTHQPSGRPVVVLACNILGNPCRFGQFDDFDTIEDNCESFGAQYQGRRTGSFGLMASHSFFFSHHLNTMEGGMITTDDRTCYEMLLCLRSHGWTRSLPADNVLGATVGAFEFILPGYNVRPMEVQAAIGRVQLDKFPAQLRIRRENALSFPYAAQAEVGASSWFGFAVQRTPTIDTTCETRPVVSGNILRSPLARYFTPYAQATHFPVAERITDTQVYIGNPSTPVDWATVFGREAVA